MHNQPLTNRSTNRITNRSTSTALKQISALYRCIYRCSNAYNFVSKCNIVIFVTFTWLQAKVANKLEVCKLFGLGNEANARGIKH